MKLGWWMPIQGMQSALFANGIVLRVGGIELMAIHIRRVTEDLTLRQGFVHLVFKKMAQ